jgi:O-antigen/teichoic acid export membrane protein
MQSIAPIEATGDASAAPKDSRGLGGQGAASASTLSSQRRAANMSRSGKALVLSSGKLLTTGFSIVSVAILARLLTRDDYATYRQVLLVFSFASPLLGLALPQALYYFIPQSRGRERTVLVENLLLLGASGLVFGAALLLGGNRLIAEGFNNDALAPALLVAALYFAVMLPGSAFPACMMANGHAVLVALVTAGNRALALIIMVTVAWFYPTSLAVVCAMTACAVVGFVVELVLMFRACRAGSARPRWLGLRQQLSFSVPLGIASTASIASSLIDKTIVSARSTPDEFAVYVNGATEIPLVNIVAGSVNSVLLPDMSRLCAEGKKKEAIGLWQRAAAKTSLVVFPVLVMFWILAPDIITILFSEKYSESVHVFRVFLLLLPARIVYFGPALIAAGRNKLVLVAAISGLAGTVALAIPMMKFAGIVGAALSAVLSTYLFQIALMVRCIAREYRLSLVDVLPLASLGRSFLVAALSSAVLVPSLYLDSVGPIVRLGVFVPAYCLVVAVAYYHWGMVSKQAFLGVLGRLRVGRRQIETP